MTSIRIATLNDIPAMVELSEQFRAILEQHQPHIWRKADESHAAQTSYFEKLLIENTNSIVLVHETPAHLINAFVVASLVASPPVYDPGGMTCMIDDFCVSQPELWKTVGKSLLHSITNIAHTHGAVQVIVVCPHLDKAKRVMLRGAGLKIASEWYTRELV